MGTPDRVSLASNTISASRDTLFKVNAREITDIRLPSSTTGFPDSSAVPPTLRLLHCILQPAVQEVPWKIPEFLELPLCLFGKKLLGQPFDPLLRSLWGAVGMVKAACGCYTSCFFGCRRTGSWFFWPFVGACNTCRSQEDHVFAPLSLPLSSLAVMWDLPAVQSQVALKQGNWMLGWRYNEWARECSLGTAIAPHNA